MDGPRQDPWCKATPKKRSVREAGDQHGQWAPRPGCDGSHGCGGRVFPRAVRFPSWRFVCPCDFSVYAAILSLKRE